MEITGTRFPEVKLIKNYYAEDLRGSFVKLYNSSEFDTAGLRTDFKESYYSVSGKDVIRGMHFQLPPFEHGKLVHVLNGAVKDIVLDLRRGSADYGKCMETELCAGQHQALYIPAGFAHGFQSLEDHTVMVYYVTSGYEKEHDAGIRWDSIPYEWNAVCPILSERDRSFPRLQEFQTPFS